MSIFSPLVTQGFGPGISGGIITTGYVSSLESVLAAIQKWKTQPEVLDIPIPTTGRSSSRYEKSDRTGNFSIKVGIVLFNNKMWNEDKKVNYITRDDDTIVRMRLTEVRVPSNEIFIRVNIKEN